MRQVGIESLAEPFVGGHDGTVCFEKLFSCAPAMGLVVKASQLLPPKPSASPSAAPLVLLHDLVAAGDVLESLLSAQVRQLELENALLRAELEVQTQCARDARDQVAPLTSSLVAQQALLNLQAADAHARAQDAAHVAQLDAELAKERARAFALTVALERSRLSLRLQAARLDAIPSVVTARVDLAVDDAVEKLALARRLLHAAGQWPTARLVSASLARLWQERRSAGALGRCAALGASAESALDALERHEAAQWSDGAGGPVDAWTELLDALLGSQRTSREEMEALLGVAVPSGDTVERVRARLRGEAADLAVAVDVHRVGADVDADAIARDVARAAHAELAAEAARAAADAGEARAETAAARTERDCALQRVDELQSRLGAVKRRPEPSTQMDTAAEPGLWRALRRAREETAQLRAAQVAAMLGGDVAPLTPRRASPAVEPESAARLARLAGVRVVDATRGGVREAWDEERAKAMWG